MGKQARRLGLVGICLVALVANAAEEAGETVVITVSGDVATPLRMTSGDLARFGRRTVRVPDHGAVATFEGVAVVDVLAAAGAPTGKALRGPDLVKFLVVDAADGYRVVFSLAELDPAYADREVILADRRDGEPLTQKEGPLRLVVPGEKMQARWVRQVKELRVQAAR